MPDPADLSTADAAGRVEPSTLPEYREFDQGEPWPDELSRWWICKKCQRAYHSPTTGRPPANCKCLNDNIALAVEVRDTAAGRVEPPMHSDAGGCKYCSVSLRSRDHYDDERREAVAREAGWKARAELAERELRVLAAVPAAASPPELDWLTLEVAERAYHARNEAFDEIYMEVQDMPEVARKAGWKAMRAVLTQAARGQTDPPRSGGQE